VGRKLGHWIYAKLARNADRYQSHSTCFMRNVPQLELACSLLEDRLPGSRVKVASLGCSTGAELYSALWVFRSRRPDLGFVACGVDLSEAVIEAARAARYRPGVAAASSALFLAGMPELPLQQSVWPAGLFEVDGDSLRVRDWVRAGTSWRAADASDPDLRERIGRHDVVMANNFLGPMPDADAESCLRNVASVVEPGGYLIVDGVDLDLKARVVASLGLVPICERIEEIHYADPTKRGWPWTRWSHEPLERDRGDWRYRYATVFRVPARIGRPAADAGPPGSREEETRLALA
jgi:chemotaxis methyl-accepting protein methylase